MRFSESIKILSLLGGVYLLGGIFLPITAFLTDHSRACALNYNCPAYEFEYLVTTTSAWHYFRAVAPIGLSNFIVLGLIGVLPLSTALCAIIVNLRSSAQHGMAWIWQTYRALVIGTGGVLLLEIAEAALVTSSRADTTFQVFAPFSLVALLIVMLVEALFVVNLITLRRSQTMPSLIA